MATAQKEIELIGWTDKLAYEISKKIVNTFSIFSLESISIIVNAISKDIQLGGCSCLKMALNSIPKKMKFGEKREFKQEIKNILSYFDKLSYTERIDAAEKFRAVYAAITWNAMVY